MSAQARRKPRRAPRRRNVDCYTDNRGAIHPIAGSKGYKVSKTHRGGAALQTLTRSGGRKAITHRPTTQRRPTRRNLDMFRDSKGRLHPIRGSKGYTEKPRAASRLLADFPMYPSYDDVRRAWRGASTAERSELKRRAPGYVSRLEQGFKPSR